MGSAMRPIHRRIRGVLVALVASSVLLVACGGGSSTSGSTTLPDDLLAQIVQTGVLRVSTDADFPPQSSYDEAKGQWQGFDIDVANEIAKRMGVVTKWETPSRNALVAGNWNGGWDISVDSMSITEERARVLEFTEPYYFTPAGLAVPADSDVQAVAQLAGKRIGVCDACTYRLYLERTLVIPGFDFEFVVPEDIEIVTYDTDSAALKDLTLGRIDAVISAVPTIEAAIANGRGLRLVGDPVFLEPLAIAADRSSALPAESLVAELNRIISDMHADGTLSEFSLKWYGVDFTKGPE